MTTMNLLTFTTIIAAASAAQLPLNAYLPAPQGGIQGNQRFGGQFARPGGSDTGNTRAQQEIEKNAAILKLDQDVNENGFHYSYETSNGIRAEESGNDRQTQGGFSYKGDDGTTYSIVFTAGEGGFRAQGDHLPVAPPTPEAILQALDQNAKDEAAGIFDDGKYRPEANEKDQGQGPSFSSGQTFGSANHQSTFNANSGYHY